MTNDNQYRKLEFELDELKMNSMRRWYAKMTVKEILPKVHREYELKIEFNREAFDKEIARLKDYLSTLEKQKKGVLITRELDEKITDTNRKLQEENIKLSNAIMKNEMFLADAKVTESKYIKNGTQLLLSVTDQFINFIIERKDRLSQYLLTLTYVKHDDEDKPTQPVKQPLAGEVEIKAGKPRKKGLKKQSKVTKSKSKKTK